MSIKNIRGMFMRKKEKQMLIPVPQILEALPNQIKDPNKIRELRNKLAKVEAHKLNIQNYLHKN